MIVVRKSIGEKVFDFLNHGFLILMVFVTLYPFYYVLCASLSDPYEVVASGGLLLWPKGFQPGAYGIVFRNPNVSTGYANTLFYVFVGTGINILLTILAAYVLSRKWVYGRSVIMMLITFTMFFSGGLIPNYILVKSLHLIDTRWALIFPNAVAVWNIIIMRTYFNTIPDSMEESAKMDGANDFLVLFKIMLPLAIPAVAVNILFYAVGHWNAWFNALIYLKSKNLFPLQIFLRQILLQSQVQDMADYATEPVAENLKYAVVIVSTVPILCIYPFLQRYFMQGIMVGAIKE